MTETELLKRKAAKAYQRYHTIGAAPGAETMGNRLLQHISVDASVAARNYNEAMARLKEIDPSCPSYEPL